jgi:hypothetical protein
MSAARAALTENAIEISASDRLPEGEKPSDFYKSILDGVNGQAAYYGWKGVTFKRVCYSKETRVFSVTVGRGAAPATLHLMKKHVAETSRDGGGLA